MRTSPKTYSWYCYFPYTENLAQSNAFLKILTLFRKLHVRKREGKRGRQLQSWDLNRFLFQLNCESIGKEVFSLSLSETKLLQTDMTLSRDWNSAEQLHMYRGSGQENIQHLLRCSEIQSQTLKALESIAKKTFLPINSQAISIPNCWKSRHEMQF